MTPTSVPLPPPLVGHVYGQVIQASTCTDRLGDGQAPEAAGRGSEDVFLCQLISLGRALALGVLLVGLTSSLPAVQAASPGVLITEVLAANTHTVADDQGRYTDWIELHNPTGRPITLAGYTLSDDPDAPAKWSLPAATLAPGGFLVIWGLRLRPSDAGRLAHELPVEPRRRVCRLVRSGRSGGG